MKLKMIGLVLLSLFFCLPDVKAQTSSSDIPTVAPNWATYWLLYTQWGHQSEFVHRQ